MKRAFAGILLVGALAGFASCASPDDIGVTLVDVCAGAQARNSCSNAVSMREVATYTEIAVFKSSCGSTCPQLAQLAVGDTSGAIARTVVSATAAPPAIGELEKDNYAFAVVLRDENCGVLAYGCTCANLKDVSEVNISAAAWPRCPGGETCCAACEQPLDGEGACPGECNAGVCGGTGTTDGGPTDAGSDADSGTDATTPDGSTGNCSLSVVASGAFAAPASAALVTGPAVVAADGGFVLAYRTQDVASDALSATLHSLSSAGTLGGPGVQPLGTCSGQQPQGGLGLAYFGGQGMLTMGRPDCAGNGAGADFVAFGGDGQPGGHSTIENPAFSDLTLARVHSVAERLTPGDFEFVYLTGGQLQSGTLEGTGFKSGSTVTNLFGAQPAGFGQVAATSTVRAHLARLPDDARVAFQVGAQSAGETPLTEVTRTGEGGAALFGAGDWGAVTAFGDRAAAIVPNGLALDLAVADQTGALVGDLSISGTSFRGGDITTVADDLIVVGTTTGSMTFYRVSGATGTPVLPTAPRATFSGTVGSVDISSFEGDRIAVASVGTQVAVVWLDRFQPSAGQDVGGWAVLDCAP